MITLRPEHLLYLAKYSDTSGWAPLEGERSEDTTPEHFPGLSTPGCEFLYGIATAATCLENYSARYGYIPPYIPKVIEMTEELIRKKDGREDTQPPYCLSSLLVLTDIPYSRVTQIDPVRIQSLNMTFSSNDPDNPGKTEVLIQPNAKRAYLARGYEFLEGCTQKAASNILSLRGMNPAIITQVMTTYSEDPALFSIMAGNTTLEITFSGGRFYETTTATPSYGIANCQILFSGKSRLQISFPLTDFNSNKLLEDPLSIDHWLSNITKKLIMCARLKGNKQILSPQEDYKKARLMFTASY